MQRAASPRPTRPEMTSTRFAGQRLKRETKSDTNPRAAMTPIPPPSIQMGIVDGSKAARSAGKTSTKNIGCSLMRQGDWIGDDVDSVGIDDVHDQHAGAGRKPLAMRRDRLILHHPIVDGRVNFPEAGAPARDR